MELREDGDVVLARRTLDFRPSQAVSAGEMLTAQWADEPEIRQGNCGGRNHWVLFVADLFWPIDFVEEGVRSKTGRSLLGWRSSSRRIARIGTLFSH